MRKFIVRYCMDGEAEFEAESAEEAQAMFDDMSIKELAENADLVADDAKTPEAIKQEIEEIFTRMSSRPRSPASGG